MAFVLYHLTTNCVGCDADEVYEIPDDCAFDKNDIENADYLEEVGYDLAKDNAESYGIEPEDDGVFEPEDPFGFSYEMLKGTREEIEEEYGTINTL